MSEVEQSAWQVNSLSATAMLQLWELLGAQNGLQRSLGLLAASIGQSVDALAQLSLGQRDALLLELRALCFGQQLASVTACPQCNESQELNFSVNQLLAEGRRPALETLSLHSGAYVLSFRLPTSADLQAVQLQKTAVIARDFLLARCLLSAERDGTAESLTQLPATVIDEVIARMEAVDPLADIQFDLRCEYCQHTWQAGFDIGSFFWTEIEAWAQRTLREIHLLASTYGWSETQILALSPQRRQSYLTLISK